VVFFHWQQARLCEFWSASKRHLKLLLGVEEAAMLLWVPNLQLQRHSLSREVEEATILVVPPPPALVVKSPNLVLVLFPLLAPALVEASRLQAL